MKTQIFISALVLLLLSSAACHNHLLADSPLPYTFLIPADYNGILRVVSNEECGIKPQVENGRQVLEFRKDGILILNIESFNGGLTEKGTRVNSNADETKSFLAKMKSEYYLVDNNGNKTKINQIANAEERLNNAPSILPGETTVSGYTYKNEKVEVKGNVYQDFYLYNSDTTQNEAMSLQKIEAATKALVTACRTSN